MDASRTQSCRPRGAAPTNTTSPPSTVPPRGGQVPFDDDDDDFTGAAEHATRNAGGSGGDLFSSVIGNFLGKKNQLANEEVDEQGMQRSILEFIYTFTWLSHI